jgi:putative ABC transport system permease protein
MIYLVRMAVRNLWRNKRRSLLAMVSVFLSVMAITVMHGMAGAFTDSLVKTLTRSETGHVRITTREFAAKARFFPVTENIKDPRAVQRAIETDPAIARLVDFSAERISFGVLLNNKGNSKTAAALAGDPLVEQKMLYLQKSIAAGRYIQAAGETIVGARLAGSLRLELGDQLRVVTQGADYGLHLKKFKVVGIFRTSINTLDDALFQIQLDDARELLRMGPAVQQLLVMLKDYRDAGQAATLIEKSLADPGLVVLPWTAIGEFPKLIKMTEGIYDVINWLIAFLGAFIITNIMMMVVLERRREIGILKAMGVSSLEILLMFLFEGVALGVLGSLCGVMGGFLINLYFNTYGLDYTEIMKDFKYPMETMFYFRISLPDMLKSFIIGSFVSAVVSVLPSRRAARMNPVDAIKSA